MMKFHFLPPTSHHHNCTDHWLSASSAFFSFLFIILSAYLWILNNSTDLSFGSHNMFLFYHKIRWIWIGNDTRHRKYICLFSYLRLVFICVHVCVRVHPTTHMTHTYWSQEKKGDKWWKGLTSPAQSEATVNEKITFKNLQEKSLLSLSKAPNLWEYHKSMPARIPVPPEVN